jgi:hypothetical protein
MKIKIKTADKILARITEMQTIKSWMVDIMMTKNELESIQESKQGIALDGLRYCIYSEEEEGEDNEDRRQ